MAQPVWLAPAAGSLSKIPEGVFWSEQLAAEDPDGAPVYFQVIAGALPVGIQLQQSGILSGTPLAVVNLQGVPANVSRDVTSKFAVRAYTQTEVSPGVTVINKLADRTFTLTVTGQNIPEFITPAGNIATLFDGTIVRTLQIQYTDNDPTDVVIVRLVTGSLPPGLSIDAKGLISGYTLSPGTDPSVNYEFLLEVTDGKSSNLRTFTITIDNRASLVADTTAFTVDSTIITADGSPITPPSLLTLPGSLGRIRSDNFYAFQFTGADVNGEAIRYEITLGEGVGFDAASVSFTTGSFDREGFDRQPLSLPPGLVLDPDTGWLYGYIPDLGLTEITYSFAIRVSNAVNPTVVSDFYYFTMTIVGGVDTDITWLTDSNLGYINTGSTSLLYVKAVNRGGIPLEYKLKSGSASSLPQGLSLLPTGLIAGRVSFNTFALDGNTTTFDVNIRDTLVTGVNTATTFDRTFNFTVEAYSNNGQIDVYKDFSISLARVYDAPYQNLYIQAMPPQNDRDLVNSLLENQQIIPNNLLFRADDPNFGRATSVIYDHAFGLTSSTLQDYLTALELNHYWKNLVLGSIKTAQALDDNGNVIYEVVYSQVVDNLVNAQGESVNKEVVLAYPVTNGITTTSIVYPNSLINMRDQVIDTVGQISNILPRWMLSKQANGRVLGFTPAWVIAYTKPGKSGQIAYNIQHQFGEQLNKVDFKADRYELDDLLSIHWNPSAENDHGGTGAWEPTPAETTFDVSSGTPTVFDGNAMKFIAPVDMYTNTNDFNRYLLFPKKNILQNLSTVAGIPVDWVNNSAETVTWVNDSDLPVAWVRVPT